MSGWSRNEIISAAVLVVGLLSAAGTWLAVPGVRARVATLVGAAGPDETASVPAADSFSAETPKGGGAAPADEPDTGDAGVRDPRRPGGSGADPEDLPRELADTDRGDGGAPPVDPALADTVSGGGGTVGPSAAGSGDASPEASSPLILAAEGATGLSFGEARCTRAERVVRCELSVSNPAGTEVSVGLVRPSPTTGGEGTYLELPDGRARPAAAIRFGGYVARGVTGLTKEDLPPGASSRAAIAFRDVPGGWRGAELRLAVRRDGEPATVWFRPAP